MKPIENIELLKKLQPYLKGVETEYIYYNMFGEKLSLGTNGLYGSDYIKYKTLTLEEAIELLLNKFSRAGFTKRIEGDEDSLKFPYGIYIGQYYHNIDDMNGFKTKLEAIEGMLNYLIDNNLLGKNQ